MTHAGEVECGCCVNHTPHPVDVEVHHVWPQGQGGPDVPSNRVNLCPNGHSAVHWLLLRYKKHNGLPPWDDRRRLNPYLRQIADRGWRSLQSRSVTLV